MPSSFVEFRDPQPSFVRPINAAAGGSWVYNPADITSPTRSYAPRSSDASSQLRSPYSHSMRAPPPRPLNIPAPAPVARGAAEIEDDDIDPEGIYVDQEEFAGIEQVEYEQDRQPTRPRRRFVGGFVANLRRLPRAVARNFVNDRRPAHIEQYPYLPQHDNMPHSQPRRPGEVVPPYSSPGAPVDSSVHYVQAMDMPQATLLPPPQTLTSTPSRSARSGDHSQLSLQSVSAKSSTPSGRRSRTSLPPIVRNPDPETPTSSEGSHTETNHPMVNIVPVPAPQVPQDDGTEGVTSVGHATPQPVHPPAVHIESGSPVYHEPPLADDYQRMESPARPPADPPLPKQLARLGKFFHTLNELPWLASTIAADFVPEESARARRKHAVNASWYTSKHRDVDLLGGSSSTRVLLGQGVQAPPHASSGTLPAYAQASRASVDNLRSQQPAANAYPLQYPYAIAPLPPPPPMYFYPSPAAQAAGQPTEVRPQPAYPLYLVAVPSTSASYLSSPEHVMHSSPPPIHIHSPMYGTVSAGG
ncbi:hypothetical protein K488DRAFT_83861 [Vararia minispora EC-137]|uniref:Uncharacterized protein n=1 Tax=Vararia minispora EC-137 TaxID=1314806 RepID=A0ACB8QT73_9AGAM|nr:hypothetical protein K488DRAFT_83861 [Vararia minispora EC-137]